MYLSWSAPSRLFIRSFASLEDMFGADDEDWAIYRTGRVTCNILERAVVQ